MGAVCSAADARRLISIVERRIVYNGAVFHPDITIDPRRSAVSMVKDSVAEDIQNGVLPMT